MADDPRLPADRSPRPSTAAGVLAALLACTAVAAVAGPRPDPGPLHRVLISGHSLTDDPFGEQVAAIVQSLGQRIDWEQQIVIGSPVSWRTRGDGSTPDGWGGYALGKNRDGRTGLDLLAELARAGRTEPYDTLVLAEGHNTVAVILWHDTVRHVRHFHERLVEQNPAARSFLFEPWEAIRDKADPGPWIALERDARRVWACAAGRINASLAQEGRADRVASIPAGAALAGLIEAALAGRIPGFARPEPRAVVDLFVQDDVHLTPLGLHFVALLTAGAITGLPLGDAWRPRGIAAGAAAALRQAAGEALAAAAPVAEATDFAACRALLTGSFCAAWNAYVPGEWVTRQEGCARYFGRTGMAPGDFETPNPFVAPDPATDAGYWFPPP